MAGGAWLGNSQHKERNDIEERLKRHKAALLSQAAQGKDASRVRELLLERADPNMADENDRWPLKEAAFAGEADVLEVLLKARADPNLPGEGDRALHVSAWQGYQVVTSHLLEFSADVEATDASGYSPLCGAALKGHTGIVRLLLDYGANPSRSVNVTGHGKLNPLRAAKEGRFLEVAEVLKEAIAQGEKQPKKGLMSAVASLGGFGNVLERKASQQSGRLTPARGTPESVSSRRSDASAHLVAVSDCLKGCCCCCGQQKLTLTGVGKAT